MEKDFWQLFGLIFLIANTFSIIILLEMIVWGKPFITLFIVVFYMVFQVNKKMLKKI